LGLQAVGQGVADPAGEQGVGQIQRPCKQACGDSRHCK
jgi:hypothetical protein